MKEKLAVIEDSVKNNHEKNQKTTNRKRLHWDSARSAPTIPRMVTEVAYPTSKEALRALFIRHASTKEGEEVLQFSNPKEAEDFFDANSRGVSELIPPFTSNL
eukprot:TRINITY_DN5866_c0_g1_i2.p2 TRINITY_DN5866_c0_g1~~TRINITY_DN5866_c0_g1_i2.p2  ORF type:complete len:103 (+),score=20.68 TRINITY_DN5866_c0_g1_i2:160-468(+)